MKSLPRIFALTTAACLLGAGTLPAQGRTAQAVHPKLRPVLESIRANNEWVLEQQISICEIPAPPFKESVRAAEYKRRLESLGLRNVRIDEEGNVLGERPGRGEGPTVVIAGHLDTVFPEGTDVTVKRSGARLEGPGIGDDCRGLAVLLAVARALDEAKVETNGTIIFVGNVGEEGPGNLRGVRHLFEKELRGRIDYFISVDGAGLNVTSRAVGSHRYRITYQGPGGHSYGAFGIPNPIHALGRAMAKIADLQVPNTPKTTFNVGIIGGGTSVNSIATDASMDVDLRSESAEELNKLDARFREAVQLALTEENGRWPGDRARLSVRIDTIGIRPTGAQADTAYIVRTALETARLLGSAPRTGASSTDANIPISLGVPGITIGGGGRGGGAHSPEEWYEDGPNGHLGPQWAALLVTALAGVR
jgi:acetylornithine deacetylase/succinyl-diaminopimelate desuccinylase-like protein